MEQTFKLVDFNVYNKAPYNDDSSDANSDAENEKKDEQEFYIQMFGLNEKGETSSIVVQGFQPFFYIKVNDNWKRETKNQFLEEIKKRIGKYYENSIVSCNLIKKKKLYGFDCGKEYNFIFISFKNILCYNKVKNLWYTDYVEGKERKLFKNGFIFKNTNTYLYESNIPPLLRCFHIKEISPSGWVSLPYSKTKSILNDKKTTCTYEFTINYKDIVSLQNIDKSVPYKICSFDIEASSSHGDFPVPIKSYKKLASNIIDFLETTKIEITGDLLTQIILFVFGFPEKSNLSKELLEKIKNNIEIVYPKCAPKNEEKVKELCLEWLSKEIIQDEKNCTQIEDYFEKIEEEEYKESGNLDDYSEENEDNEENIYIQKSKTNVSKKIIDVLKNKKISREEKIKELNISLNQVFPRLEGDKVTFIGSTFLNYGEKEPYLNHCLVLNTCTENIPVVNSKIECCETEKDLLLSWKDLIQRENPDIIIGYNIFGFDYEFMFNRSQENRCEEEFLKLSRNLNEICGSYNSDKGKYKIEETSIKIASGEHNLKYIKMTGRLQIDLYNYFRREENLSSYKLDYVSGYFIGDDVKEHYEETAKTHNPNPNPNPNTTVVSNNLTGLSIGNFIHFEEIGYSTDYYNNGEKFKVIEIDILNKKFVIEGIVIPDKEKQLRWCLAKDDVNHMDIFRMTNGTDEDRAIIAKYCIQDCNLVHHLFNKVDVITNFIEMSKICSVPISFLVMRGQGIKLTSYIAKKCREKDTLIPVIEKGSMDEGYEGAIVLEPKCGLYLDNPVACVDYASLYPSSMISENLSHDSKVWTKEYDLEGNLINEKGEKDVYGNFIYDNLPGYKYVHIEYDTYKYIRNTPKSAAKKVISGKKICCFAQFPEGKAIMPSILEELLVARKTTRKLIPKENDEFMKNVLNKRQLGYKITANSLYGQCGAKTSTFYEKDIAACTTATGRLLLTYAQKIIEKCYGNTVCQTNKAGAVLTKAEYIYGDSVAEYTPVLVNTIQGRGLYRRHIIDICTIEQLAEKYGKLNGKLNGKLQKKEKWFQCLEPGKQTKEVCELKNVYTWTEYGWTKVKRVIRHKLSPSKKMVRIITRTGLVDVSDDHSLLLKNGQEISPKDVQIGMELLHSTPYIQDYEKLYGYDILIPDGGEGGEGGEGIKYKLFKDQIEATIYCHLLMERGMHYTLNCTDNIYKVSIINNPFKNNSIVKIEEIEYQGKYVYDLTTRNHHFSAGIGNLVVHNTDSVFFTFNLHTTEGKPITGKEALEITIELAQEAGHLASSFLKSPHDLEYEKTYMPFCLLSKKRYVGMLYETDPNKCYRKEMGIVLKRRDNASIVKDVYGGIIDILMKEQNIQKAIDFLRKNLKDIVDEKCNISKLIITKSLRSYYKNPLSIAHKVLADRIATRDPGNKPRSGDRIPFVYINYSPIGTTNNTTNNKKILQGDKIETPSYIIEKKLKIDYSFYITNQIMKPVQQIFTLVIERIWEMQNKKSKLAKFRKEVETLKKKEDHNKFQKKLEKIKNDEVKILLFDEFLITTNNIKTNNQSIKNFFNVKI